MVESKLGILEEGFLVIIICISLKSRNDAVQVIMALITLYSTERSNENADF